MRETGLPSRRSILLGLFLVAMVNLPLANATYIAHELDVKGVTVQATVAGAEVLSPTHHPRYVIGFRLPPALDPRQRLWSADVDSATYEAARSSTRIAVRVVPGKPSEYRTAGQVTSHAALVITVAGDLVVLVVVALLWAFRGRRPGGSGRAPLRLVALEDVARAKPGGSVVALDDTSYLVVGEVTVREPDSVVLDCGDRIVHIDLDGHSNPVGHEQPARVRARLSESVP